MASTLVVVFGISSIIFLCCLLLAAAVLLRGQWDHMGPSTPPSADSSASPHATGSAPGASRRPRSPYLDR